MTPPVVDSKSSKKRGQVRVAPQLEKNLNAYETVSGGAKNSKSTPLAVAAIAAGLASLALPQVADASVVYTPANQELPSPFGTLQIDLNHDGINDVSVSVLISTHIGSGHRTFVGGINAHGLVGNGIETSNGLVVADPIGELIGSSENFGANGLVASCTSRSSVSGSHHHKVKGLWRSKGSRYMGVKFSIGGETHYGWVRLKGFSCSLETPFLTGYAYESEPNKPIDSGAEDRVPPPDSDPATLGALAGGAKGLPLWRKQEPASVGRSPSER
jgi:hypothetical protein